MSVESIPFACMGCPNILPYIEEVQRLENRVVTPELRERLLAWDFSPEDIDLADAKNTFELQQSRKALGAVAARTEDCSGLKLKVVDPELQSSDGIEAECMSPTE